MMESPFLPSDTSFRYQVTTTGGLPTRTSKKMASPSRRRRAWEDPPAESSTKYDNESAELLDVHFARTVNESTMTPSNMMVNTPLNSSSSATCQSATITTHSDTTSSTNEDNKGEGNDDDEDHGTPTPCDPETCSHDEESTQTVVPRKLDTLFSICNEGRSISMRAFLGDEVHLLLAAIISCVVLVTGLTIVRQCYHNSRTMAEYTDVTPYDLPEIAISTDSQQTNRLLIDSGSIDKEEPDDGIMRLALLVSENSTTTAKEEQMKPDTTSIVLRENAANAAPTSSASSNMVLLESAPNESNDSNTSLMLQKGVTKNSRKEKFKDSLVGTSVALSEDGDIMAIASSSTPEGGGGDANNLHGWVRVFSRTRQAQIGRDISLGAFMGSDDDCDAICSISLSSTGSCLVTGWSAQIRLFQDHDQDADGWIEDAEVNRLFRNRLNRGVVIGSVAISDDCNTIAVAADSIYITRKVGTKWIMDSVHSFSAGTSGNTFRVSLSSGANASRLAIGYLSLHDDGTASGGVQVLNRQATSSKWLQLGQPLILSLEHQTWQVGDLISMSSDGTTVAVGHPMDADSRGEVLVFSYDSVKSMWNQMGGALIGEVGSSFGVALALSSDGNCVAVRDTAGLFMAYVFDPVAAAWNHFGEAFYSTTNLSMGRQNRNKTISAHPKVALSGDCNWVAIGDPSSRHNRGVAHMFQI